MKMQAGFTIAISLRTDVSPPSFASVSLGYVSSGGHHNGAKAATKGNHQNRRKPNPEMARIQRPCGTLMAGAAQSSAGLNLSMRLMQYLQWPAPILKNI
ncbi:MAG: hypothetical protein ACPGAM_10095 [Candidatus Puniceispirillaceae bacterium]|jgi:hypothetical protein